MALYPLGPWIPDLNTLYPGASAEALNVVPGPSGYSPFPVFERYADNVDDIALGAFSCVSAAGIVYNFAGTATKLYVAATDGLTWLDATRLVGGDYTTPDQNIWTFTQFDDIVLAQNGAAICQVYTLDVSTNFVDDAGIPIASYAGTVRGFAVAAKLLNDNRGIAWSAAYDPLDWVPSDETMSDSQHLPDGGDIQAFVGGEVGIIFQRRSIQRMVFAGPPLTFNFDKISLTLGCWANGSVAAYGDLIFFLAENGFHMLRGGQEVSPIGDGKIDLWFRANVNSASLHTMSSAINPAGKTYVVGFTSNDSTDEKPDTFLVYHWPTGQWSKVNQRHDLLYQGITQQGYNLDTIDALNPDPPNTTGIDGMNFSFDSNIFNTVGALGLSMFDVGHYNGFFTGEPRSGAVSTGDLQFTPGRKSLLLGCRPIAEGTTVGINIQDFTRDRLQDSSIAGPVSPANYRGIVPMRNSGRYHRLRMSIPIGSAWTHMIGIDDLNIIAQSV